MKKKKLFKIIVLVIVIFPIVFWGISLAKCEILTFLYGKEFDEIYQENTMIGDIEFLKILDYSSKSARVYYISANKSMGNILRFSKNDGQWEYEKWETTVWSTSGTADDVVYPYLWHWIYFMYYNA